MNLCTAALAASFDRPIAIILLMYGLGFLGILGWGLSFEIVLRKHFRQVSVCHAYLQGSVLVSILLLGFSLVGAARPAFYAVAWTGCAALAAVLLLLWKRPRSIQPTIASTRDVAAIVIAGALVAPMFLLLARPVPLFSDAAAIWFFHAKELACEPLFRAHYIREPIWAGTHSEYPLFAPLMHAYFFAISDSFRDDWLALWQIASAFSALYLWVDAIRKQRGIVFAAATALMIAAILYPLLFEARVEFTAVIFALLATLCLVTGELSRSPLYLFGLAFTKNEGLVLAALFAVLLVVLAPAGERRSRARILVPCGALVAAWIPILVKLPSNHETYPSRALMWSAWTAGFGNVGTILEECLAIVRHQPWGVPLLLLPLGIVVAITRAGKEPKDGTTITHLLLWPAIMLGIFLGIYMVSPWGPTLPRVTLTRLLAVLLVPMQLGLALLAIGLVRQRTRWISAAGALLCIALAANSAIVAAYDGYHLVGYALRRGRAGDFGTGAYKKDPDWQRAFDLDAKLPPASRGAGINVVDHLVLNYTLYPRYIYAARPEVIARTLLPWAPWVRAEDVPFDELGFRFIIEENRVVRSTTP